MYAIGFTLIVLVVYRLVSQETGSRGVAASAAALTVVAISIVLLALLTGCAAQPPPKAQEGGEDFYLVQDQCAGEASAPGEDFPKAFAACMKQHGF